MQMSSKSVLWIPCFNEGMQRVNFGSPEIITENRSTIYETLQLLSPIIDNKYISDIIITDDGSADDTLEYIKRFKKENDYGSNFIIDHHNKNKGKSARFFDVREYINKSIKPDVFMMTDADMVELPSLDIFSSMLQNFYTSDSMLVSHQGERDKTLGSYGVEEGYYLISDALTSGTRSLLVSDLNERFKKIGLSNLQTKTHGFGLEHMLNTVCHKSYRHVTYDTEEYIPKFLKAFRKGKLLQVDEINRTREKLSKLIGF